MCWVSPWGRPGAFPAGRATRRGALVGLRRILVLAAAIPQAGKRLRHRGRSGSRHRCDEQKPDCQPARQAAQVHGRLNGNRYHDCPQCLVGHRPPHVLRRSSIQPLLTSRQGAPYASSVDVALTYQCLSRSKNIRVAKVDQEIGERFASDYIYWLSNVT